MNRHLNNFFRFGFWNTFYFNFKYLPFRQAIRFPILISSRVRLSKVSGKLIFKCIQHTGMVQIGFGDVGVFDDKLSRSIWQVGGTVIFNGKASIGHGSKISVEKGGILNIGNNFKITAETTIIAHSEITIGNDCLLSWDILIMDSDFHTIKNHQNIKINNDKKIMIGNKVWISCRCTILKGAFIPAGCIIGANSLVNKVLEKENCLYAGNPTKCIKADVIWE